MTPGGLRASIIAAAGGAIGWLATREAQGIAQTVAALCTAAWMLSQTVAIFRPGRCARDGCHRRLKK